jgi:DNA-binding cell septation regulator SpoVG
MNGETQDKNKYYADIIGIGDDEDIMREVVVSITRNKGEFTPAVPEMKNHDDEVMTEKSDFLSALEMKMREHGFTWVESEKGFFIGNGNKSTVSGRFRRIGFDALEDEIGKIAVKYSENHGRKNENE